MPALSPTMKTGNIASIKVKPGMKILPGDLIMDIETDKATMGWESQEEGIVAAVLVKEGDQDVKVGSVVFIVVDDAKDVPAFKDYTAAAAAAPAPAAPAATAATAKPATPPQAAEGVAARSPAGPGSMLQPVLCYNLVCIRILYINVIYILYIYNVCMHACMCVCVCVCRYMYMYVYRRCLALAGYAMSSILWYCRRKRTLTWVGGRRRRSHAGTKGR